MRRAGVLISIVLLSACGTTPVASTSPSPASATHSAAPSPGSPPASASPTGAGILFAVVEGQSPMGAEADTVAIVGLDGYARAKAKFTPRERPYVGNAAVPLQPVAQVVGRAVYYIDGYGTVRALRVGAQPRALAAFGTQPAQYETWFSVSPDGASVIAGVLQYPAIGTAPSPCEGLQCMPPLVGPWGFKLMLAAGGATPTVLQQYQSSNHPDSQTGGWHPTFPVAWIGDGPVAMIPVSIGTQNAWWGGPLHVLDGAGRQIRQIGGADCNSDIVTSGRFIPCTSGQYAVTIRDISGTVLWASQVGGFNALSLHVSADGQGVSDGIKVETRTGGLVALPQGFSVEGWLDNSTVIGRSVSANGRQGDLAWVKLTDPSTVHDLGFEGNFAGTLG